MNLPEATITPESLPAPTDPYAAIRGINNAAIIIGLQSKHVYAGTVPEAVVRQRRAKNRAARSAGEHLGLAPTGPAESEGSPS